MMNADPNQSLSDEREIMMSVFAELRASKFYFPRGWDVDRNVAGTELHSREHDPAPDFEAQPRPINVQDKEEMAAGADRPMQRRYMSDAEILGVDLLGKPAALQVYRKIQLPNYAGPAFRSAMAIVDAAFNHPLVLSAENVVVDPTAVLQQTPSTRWPEEVLDDDRVERRERHDVSCPSEPETGTADRMPQAKKRRRTFWRRTKRFVGRMFCCGAYVSDVSEVNFQFKIKLMAVNDSKTALY